jgi:Tol biopolymer transport system component
MSSISANGKIIVFSAINKAENDGSADIYWLPVDLNPLDTPSSSALATDTPTATNTNAPSVTPTLALVGTGEATVEAAPTEAVVSTAGETAIPTGTPEKANITRVTEKDSGINLWPALSPDGQFVVFVSDRKALDGELDLYIKGLNQPTDQALTTDGNEWIESAPQISPDGKQVVFQAAKQKANQQLFIMNIDGSNRTPLTATTDTSNNIRPQWSPDGRYVAFTSDRTGKNEIFIIDVTTRETWQVTASEDPILLQDWR